VRPDALTARVYTCAVAGVICVTRLLSALLIPSLILSSASCGGFFVHSTSRSFQGSVNTVQLGTVVDETGEIVQVTFVSFLQNGELFTVDFCDDQTVLFPLDQTVLVDFNPGQFCATVIVVVVIV